MTSTPRIWAKIDQLAQKVDAINRLDKETPTKKGGRTRRTPTDATPIGELHN